MLTTVDIINWLKPIVPYAYYGNEFRTDHPDAAGIVRLTGGVAPDQWSNKVQPAFQVLVRGAPKGDGGAESVAWSLLSKLHNLTEFKVAGWRVVHCTADQSTPFYLGQDENGRPIYSVNFDLIMQS
ncbi:minor capsid protein [Cohnella sp. GCM10020058]|uniref:minor capsid protein n=1 Tax=Cohnella sp. GCM10020058 TaxID=3317330 RepID=UPI0036342838